MEILDEILLLDDDRFLFFLLVFGLFFTAVGFYLTRIRIGTNKRARVLYVCDGDTLIVRGHIRKYRVRLAGMDAPEGDQPGGKESQECLRKMVGNRTVFLKIIDRDHWGRYVCFVTYFGKNINLEMVKKGQAWAYRQYFHNLSGTQKSEFLRAETNAKRNRLGLWAEENPEAPWNHRKEHQSLGTWLHFLILKIFRLLFGQKKNNNKRRQL